MTIGRTRDRKRLGRDALAAVANGEEGWQEPCVELLRQISKDYEAHNEVYSDQESRFLGRLANVLSNTLEGVFAPHFIPKKRTGRPKLDPVAQKHRFRLGLMVAMVAPKLKADGYGIDAIYREVARRLTTPEKKVTWQEVRSSWVNRDRFTDAEKQLIQHFKAVAESHPNTVEYYETFALLAEMATKSKTPLF